MKISKEHYLSYNLSKEDCEGSTLNTYRSKLEPTCFYKRIIFLLAKDIQ